MKDESWRFAPLDCAPQALFHPSSFRPHPLHCRKACVSLIRAIFNSELHAMTMENPPVDWDEQVQFLRGLAHIVRDENLSELSLESGGVRLSLKSAAPGATVVVAPSAAPLSGVAAAPDSGLVPVVSPMVGVFYRAPSPNDPNFVEVGDSVSIGQVIGVVEAMKVFNEIVSEIEGTVAEIVAQNSELVETGAPLVKIQVVRS